VTQAESQGETLREFVDSFSYGSRTDLNFKFLKNLSEPEAALFFRELLNKLGETLDDGKADRLIEHTCEWQRRGYSREHARAYDLCSLTRPSKPISKGRLALVTSSGHFVAGHDPEPFGVREMTQSDAVQRIDDFLRGAPQLSPIPRDTPREKLRVRHGGYDVRAAEADPNVVFPLERLMELEREGVIGEIAAEVYSFVGATRQVKLLNAAGAEWVMRLKEQEVDSVLLVPA
jgi:hypothetical protein